MSKTQLIVPPMALTEAQVVIIFFAMFVVLFASNLKEEQSRINWRISTNCISDVHLATRTSYGHHMCYALVFKWTT